MGERHWSYSRLADRSRVDLDGQSVGDRRVVDGRQLHEQIVRVLPVVERRSVECFAGLENERIPTGRRRPRVGAEHSPEAELTVAQRVRCGAHEPSDSHQLGSAAAASELLVVGAEFDAVDHELPTADRNELGVHRRAVRKPRRP